MRNPVFGAIAAASPDTGPSCVVKSHILPEVTLVAQNMTDLELTSRKKVPKSKVMTQANGPNGEGTEASIAYPSTHLANVGGWQA